MKKIILSLIITGFLTGSAIVATPDLALAASCPHHQQESIISGPENLTMKKLTLSLILFGFVAGSVVSYAPKIDALAEAPA